MIDKRLNFRGGGMDMGNASNQAQSASMGNTSSNTNSNTSSNDTSSNTDNSSGNDNRPYTIANVAGPVTAPITSLPSNIGFNPGFTLSTDPMDIREQYRIGNPSVTIPGGPSFVNIDNPYMTQGLETNRYNNYLGAQNLRGYIPDSINIPFAPLATKGLQFLQKFGNDKNTQFFADNVAGNYGYGYGIADYKQYMSDRMSGKVGAYGNKEQGQNALSGENEDGINALIPSQQVAPVIEATETTDELISEDDDMGFNFGTFSNPIYRKDLM
tara:strand:- start:39 stop:848 length:810 start_codon:yes stop_codon:yes gene_type:complete